jgi:hypothetical protein
VEGAADSEVELGWLRREAAQGGRDSGEGVAGTGPDQAGELGEEARKQKAKGIWSGWRDCGGCRRGVRADSGGARKKRGGNGPRRGV